MYKTNRLHSSLRVHCKRSQKTSQRVKNNCHASTLSRVVLFCFFTRYDVICDLLQYTRTECNLFIKYLTILYLNCKESNSEKATFCIMWQVNLSYTRIPHCSRENELARIPRVNTTRDYHARKPKRDCQQWRLDNFHLFCLSIQVCLGIMYHL